MQQPSLYNVNLKSTMGFLEITFILLLKMSCRLLYNANNHSTIWPTSMNYASIKVKEQLEI